MNALRKILTKDKVQLAVTLISVAIAIVNSIIVARLAPLAQDIAILKTETQANTVKDDTEHVNFVTFDTFNEVVTRIDHISNRVDSIYSIVANKK